MDSEPSDWDSDEEQLLAMWTTGIVGNGAPEKSSRSNTHTNACMDPKDLPEHLQPLMGVDGGGHLHARVGRASNGYL